MKVGNSGFDNYLSSEKPAPKTFLIGELHWSDYRDSTGRSREEFLFF
jgi:hypothetical protein